MKIITVCGSLKFYKEMMDITEKMELPRTSDERLGGLCRSA